MKLGPKQEQWLKDLESGKYAKGRSQLKTSGGELCCLGVYVETQVCPVGEYPMYIVLTADDANDLGLNDQNGTFTEGILVRGQRFSSLINLNDSFEFTNHAQMAAFIREYADLIFTEAK